MSENQIFLSYSRLDKPSAERLAGVLKQDGFDVWWDQNVMPREPWEPAIKAVLERAAAVVVLWSANSVRSDWVKFEATTASLRDVLVGCKIECIELPSPYAAQQAADLTQWLGGRDDDVYQALVAVLRSMCGADGDPCQSTLNKQQLSDNPQDDFAMDARSIYAVDPQARLLAAAPAAPRLFIGRQDDVAAVRSLLIAAQENAAPVRSLVVRGWPGVGKTTLLTTLAQDEQLSAEFADGILWTSLGQEPQISTSLGYWIRALGGDDTGIVTTTDAISMIHLLLTGRNCLLMVDDVWQLEHVEIFQRLCPSGCNILFSTRDREIASTIKRNGGVTYRLQELTIDYAMQLLEILAPAAVMQNRAACHELMTDLECLPLAIHVAAGLLASEQDMGFSIDQLVSELREGKVLLSQKAPSDMSDLQRQTLPTVALLLERSTNCLNSTNRDYFALLGVFAPKPATFDVDALRCIWELDDIKPIVRQLVSRGLLETLGDGRFQLHALLVAHADSMMSD